MPLVPVPLDQRATSELIALLNQLAQLDRQEMALTDQLRDTRRVKDQLHGAVTTLQKVLGQG